MPVDDEPLLLQTLCEMCEDLGCLAICLEDPVEGLAKIAEDERIALVITDVQMPRMNGFELAKRAREKRPELPIVLMSGAVPARPGFPVIIKPFSLPQLAEVLAPIISSRA